MAKQINVAAADLSSYEWSGSTIEYHRSQIRAHLGFRTCSAADAVVRVARKDWTVPSCACGCHAMATQSTSMSKFPGQAGTQTKTRDGGSTGK